MGKITLLLLSVFLLVGCASGHCRDVKQGSHVMVFKPDGSRQCGVGSQPLSPEEMAKQLKSIKIYSQENKSDGKIHMMVCGGSTGRINVYEINEKDVDAAKAMGFQVLEK